MKKYLFIALAVLVAACEKPILDEDVVSMKEANVILHMTQYDQEAFGNSGNRVATRAATDITELCSRLNITIFDAEGTKVKTVAQKEGDTSFGTVALTLAAGTYQLVVIAHNGEGSATTTSTEKVTFPNNKVTDTFYYYGDLVVTSEMQSYDLTLTRAVTLDAETVILLVALIAAGFKDGLELADGGEAVIQGFLHGIRCSLLLVLAHDAVDDFLRADSFVMVVDFVASRINSAGNNVQVVIVSIMVSIDQNGLLWVAITHFIEIFVGYLQQLLMGVFVTFTRNCKVKLRFLNTVIRLIGVIDECLFQLFRGVVLVYEVETLHLQKLGDTL